MHFYVAIGSSWTFLMSVSVVYSMIFSNLLHGNAIIYLTSLPICRQLAHFSCSAMQKLFLCISWIMSLGTIPRHGNTGSKVMHILDLVYLSQIFLQKDELFLHFHWWKRKDFLRSGLYALRFSLSLITANKTGEIWNHF